MRHPPASPCRITRAYFRQSCPLHGLRVHWNTSNFADFPANDCNRLRQLASALELPTVPYGSLLHPKPERLDCFQHNLQGHDSRKGADAHLLRRLPSDGSEARTGNLAIQGLGLSHRQTDRQTQTHTSARASLPAPFPCTAVGISK